MTLRPLPGKQPLAHSVDGHRVYCTRCLPPALLPVLDPDETRIAEVYPWTANLEPGETLTCEKCGHILASTPPTRWE